MPNGPSKYDDLITLVRERTGAAGVILLGGRRGSGFGAQLPAEAADSVPEMLRNIADQMEGK